MKLSSGAIEEVAKLARLALSEKEKERYAAELSAVLSYMEILNEADTNEVPGTNQVTGLEDVVRADEAAPRADSVREEIIRAFPDASGKLLRVPAVFE